MEFLRTLLDEQNIVLLLEVLLIVTVFLLILKKGNIKPQNSKLTKYEEECLVSAFEPDSLTEHITPSHRALNPHIVKGKIKEHIFVDGLKCVNFATHNYLGLVGDDNIQKKATKCIEKYGVGTCGPRCFYGTNVAHLQLENSLAEFLGTESAITYSFGFVTISSAIAAYAKKQNIIFVDQKRNFAIQQGLVASKSEVKYFKHNSVKDLEQILKKVHSGELTGLRKAGKSRRLLVLEGIYFNTGEICPLPEFIKLSKKYKLRVFIDESVSFGVLGKTGRGILEHFTIPREEVDLTMGSFEYALASGGGFCAGSKFLIDHQVLSGLGYCFSASLPPCLVVAAEEALKVIQKNPEKLKKLKDCCQTLHNELNSSEVIKQYFNISGNEISPIHLLEPKENAHCCEDRILDDIIDKCLKKCVAICRAAKLEIDDALVKDSLRITSSIFHSELQIRNLVTILEDVCKEVF